MTLERINLAIANHTTIATLLFFADLDAGEKARSIESIRFGLVKRLRFTSISAREINSLFDRFLLLLGKVGVRDVVINGRRVVAELCDRGLTEKQEDDLADLLAAEGFEVSRVATRKAKSKNITIVQYPKEGSNTKSHSFQSWKKAYGY